MRNPLSTVVLADGITILHYTVEEDKNCIHLLSGTHTPASVSSSEGCVDFFLYYKSKTYHIKVFPCQLCYHKYL